MSSIQIQFVKDKLALVECANCHFIDTVFGVRRDYTRLRGDGYGYGRCNKCGSEAFTLLEDIESGEKEDC